MEEILRMSYIAMSFLQGFMIYLIMVRRADAHRHLSA
jgi:hypothetical protein